jgi:hypothetical protein
MTSAETDEWASKISYGMPHEVYLKDPVPGGSLSSSGARMMLAPNCPAKFDYWRKHRRPSSTEFDIGTAAHKVLLGAGPELVVIDADNYKKAAPRVERDHAYMADKTPVLQHQMDAVNEMAAAARRDPVAGPLLAEGTGEPEVSFFWIDGPTGIHCRARLDYLSYLHNKDGRLLIIDYKTTSRSAAPSKIERAILNHGYHMQAAHLIDAVIGTGHAEDALVLFIFQETDAPYLVTVVEPHPISAIWVGRELNDKARQVFAKCNAANVWPGYASDIVEIELPIWEQQRMERIVNAHPIRGIA